uniref:Uncharacterized protein n=1 Tax=Oryza rufipogon TaxID=4529 RepID=A0A0E0RA91_ORYRU
MKNGARVAHQMASTAHGLAELPLLILLVLIMMNLMVAASTVQEKKDKKPLSKAWAEGAGWRRLQARQTHRPGRSVGQRRTPEGGHVGREEPHRPGMSTGQGRCRRTKTTSGGSRAFPTVDGGCAVEPLGLWGLGKVIWVPGSAGLNFLASIPKICLGAIFRVPTGDALMFHFFSRYFLFMTLCTSLCHIRRRGDACPCLSFEGWGL